MMTISTTRPEIRRRRRPATRGGTYPAQGAFGRTRWPRAFEDDRAQAPDARRAAALELLVYPADVERPGCREECQGMPRPCPFVSCSHHLYLDVNPQTGAIKLNFPHLEVWEMAETCSLDVADRGGITLEEVGAILNLTRERIRQVEVRGLSKSRTTPAASWDCLPSARPDSPSPARGRGQGVRAGRLRYPRPHGAAGPHLHRRSAAAARRFPADGRAGFSAAGGAGVAVHRDRARHRHQHAHRRRSEAHAGLAGHADRRARVWSARGARVRSGRGARGGRGDSRRIGTAESDRMVPRILSAKPSLASTATTRP